MVVEVLPSELLNIREKDVSNPIEAPRDRIWQKFPAENISDVNNEFNQLFFRCSVPSSDGVIKSFDCVLPLRFRFKDRGGKNVDRNDIALAANSLDSVFRTIQVTANSQTYTAYPAEKAYMKLTNRSVDYILLAK